MKNKETSIEWFWKKLLISEPEEYNNILDQAKAMHKEELKESYFKSVTFSFETFNHYYNETYGGNDE